MVKTQLVCSSRYCLHLVLWILFRNKTKALDVLEIRSKSYEDQIKAIEDTHRKEIETRDNILKKYDTILLQLEKDYEEKNGNKQKEKTGNKKIVKEYNDRPAIRKSFSRRYGLNYVE